MDFERIAWLKPSGHGPSGEHKIEEETDGVLTLSCGRSYDREELEIDVEEVPVVRLRPPKTPPRGV